VKATYGKDIAGIRRLAAAIVPCSEAATLALRITIGETKAPTCQARASRSTAIAGSA